MSSKNKQFNYYFSQVAPDHLPKSSMTESCPLAGYKRQSPIATGKPDGQSPAKQNNEISPVARKRADTEAATRGLTGRGGCSATELRRSHAPLRGTPSVGKSQRDCDRGA
jgi:hypothetical protein